MKTIDTPSKSHLIDFENLKTQVEHLTEQNNFLAQKNEYLTQQIEWFKRQIFGSKSERIIEPVSNEIQLTLFDLDEKKQLKEKTNVISFERSKSDSKQSKTAITFPCEN